MRNKVYLLILLGSINLAVIAQPVFGSKAGYSAICIEEQATGFNWDNKRWVKSNFKTETHIVSRIAIEKYKEAADNNFLMCSDKSGQNKSFSNYDYVYECYSVVKSGAKPTMLDARMCTEVWENKKLLYVGCSDHSSKFNFQPAGNFIKQPWHADLRSDEQYKDSLTLSVGKCTPIQ